MVKTSVMLNTINDVKNFVQTVSKYPYDIDLISGRYTVDAKSIMGIFSLDLTKPIELQIYANSCDDFIADIKSFVVE